MSYNYLFKLLIIGEENTGKTKICNRLSGGLFNPSYDETIGIEFSTCFTQIYDNLLIKCQLWDTSGRKIFLPVINSYFKGVAGIIIVYDVTDRRSFNRIDFWLDKIKNSSRRDEEIKILLIGNKCDKINRNVSYEEGKKKAEKNNLLFFESSAKENPNIPIIIREFCKNIFDSYDPKEHHSGIKLPVKYELAKPIKKDNSYENCCCCC